jgi:hypothetical protein
MVCDYGGDLGSALTSGNPYDAIACTFTNAAGTELTATLVFAAVGVSLFIYSDSAALPTSVLLIVGGALLGLVTSGVLQIVGVVVLLVGAAALWVVINSLREP